jgi:hypothetical protein
MEWDTLAVATGSVQMIEKPTAFPSFLGRRSLAPRPLSTATDFFDIDNASDEGSLLSLDDGSESSVSTVEATTPQSAGLGGFEFHFDHKPVEGPVGPHLFSGSPDSFTHQFQETVPIKAQQLHEGRPMTALNRAVAELDETQVRSWSPLQVAEWMAEAGFDSSVVDKFLLHDISGRVLLDLQFEDLKELDISSFGKRHRVMSSIQHLRNSSLISLETPIERSLSKSPPRPARALTRSVRPEESHIVAPSRSRSRRRGRKSDDVSPGESISIVAIEQLLPKPHICSKGEECSKWQRQQRKILRLQQEFAEAAEETEPDTARFDAVPSVVGSSDALGPTVPFKITADRLNEVSTRDPQENVRQFLTFQHIEPSESHSPSPPPAASAAYAAKNGLTEQLRDLPKLTIPYSLPDVNSPWRTPIPAAKNPSTPQLLATHQLRNDPYHYGGVASPADIYRTDTPFSAADVPVTAHPIDPCGRPTASSVPPDMRYGAPQNNTSPPASTPRRRLTKQSFTTPSITPVKEIFPSPTADSFKPNHKSTDILNHAGWMRKRRTTKMLRHEWADHYFALNGTRLVMLDNDMPDAAAIEHIDVDDYAVHAYSVASASKLSASFKKSILGSSFTNSQPSFAFSLIPDADKGNSRKIFEKSAKSHHFAVQNTDEKIEWMRRLMLAKAASRNGYGHHEI